VSNVDRYTPTNPCPICGGHERLARGHGQRCAGFLSGDYAYCTREEYADGLPLDERTEPPAYLHWLAGECNCGTEHSSAARVNGRRRPGALGEEVAAYDYRDERGVVLYQNVRYQPKRFRQRRPDGTWKIGDVRRVPYRLPELLAADSTATVFVCEGEKDCDRLRSLGLVATSAPVPGSGGRGWTVRTAEALRGRHVVVLVDNDDAGRTGAENAARVLHGIAATVRTLELPGLPPGGDVSDWLDHGGTVEELLSLASAAPLWGAAERPASEPLTVGQGSSANLPDWPEAPEDCVYSGLAGQVVEAIRPHTEADPVAVLIVFLAMFGNLIGRTPHVLVGETHHPARICPVLVGPTAKGRKGEAQAQVDALLGPLDPDWTTKCRGSGLASGEGVIYHVRDEVWKKVQDKNGGTTDELVDEGVKDKRLVVVEAEFGRTLRVMHGERNTLSAVIRDAWDGRQLRNMTRNSPLRATEAHITIVGHITLDEFRAEVASVDLANGFLNRLLPVCVRRAQHLARPTRMPKDVREALWKAIGRAAGLAKQQGEVPLSRVAEGVWDDLYPELTEERPGMLGAMTARAEPYVLRLALINALLDCAPEIQPAHLGAAVALWRYVESSVEYVFGDATGNPTADAILAALRRRGPLPQSVIYRDVLGGQVGAKRITAALEMLTRLGRVAETRGATTDQGGRPATVWETVSPSRARRTVRTSAEGGFCSFSRARGAQVDLVVRPEASSEAVVVPAGPSPPTPDGAPSVDLLGRMDASPTRAADTRPIPDEQLLECEFHGPSWHARRVVAGGRKMLCVRCHPAKGGE